MPKQARFYAAHFKLDLIAQATEMLQSNDMLLLLDTDMAALRKLDDDLLRRRRTAGIGVFDISDQVFPTYGCERVIGDLETVAGRRLASPRWYGGEFLSPEGRRRVHLIRTGSSLRQSTVEESHRLQ
ncbi:hypothetical protein [Caballeronia udeis]|uniref:hypothetical protein n=1 Tax=Caballeronia udeis TaxID=1232866 RepID=UPI0012E97329|nr:hypothetical protein [Caballeronia udeis]